jgi:hypothetical protein
MNTGLPDERLVNRLERIIEQFSANPTASIPQACGTPWDTKATYRFLDNERVTPAGIIAGQRAATQQRLTGLAQVLLVQDTTSFNFSHHPATQGLGVLENEQCRGFLAHSTLAVSVEGVPLGVLEQQVWARGDERTRDQRHQRDFSEKESYKWVTGLPDRASLPATLQAIVVGDAEAHIYDFLSVLHERGFEALVRATDYRSVTDLGVPLFAAVAQAAVQATATLELQRRPDRAARRAQVTLRFGTVTLKRPVRATSSDPHLSLQVVEVMEVNPPPDAPGIHWVLLTSLPVTTVEAAWQVVNWYQYRWLIERFHYILKSGCRIEDRQLRAEHRLERLVAVYSGVAWQLLWLTYQARVTPAAPCTRVLSAVEWQALFLFTQKSKSLPATPPTLHQATRWIGQLGGFLGRKGDGEPGVQVLWRGWSRLQDIAATYALLSPPKNVGNG